MWIILYDNLIELVFPHLKYNIGERNDFQEMKSIMQTTPTIWSH